MNPIGTYLEEHRILVCCGAGGVGKTTTSAALAVGAARAGRRVLVLTIDPSKRLAETLGVARNHPEPVELPRKQQREAGIEPPGSLSAWMLDPRLVSDQTVRRLMPQGEAERMMENRIYQQVTRMIAGMQEYTAMEALHQFVQTGRYDLVILDTPPSRNALNFLEAPTRLNRFLDGRIFKLFVPKEDGLLKGARFLIGRVMGAVFGEELFQDLQGFFGSYGSLLRILGGNARKMRKELQQPGVAFLLVTSPAREAVDDAHYFREKIRELELPFGGFILNRSRAPHAGRRMPDQTMLPPQAEDRHRRALEKLRVLARTEAGQAAAGVAMLEALQAEVGPETPVIAVPEMAGGVNDMAGLVEVSSLLVEF